MPDAFAGSAQLAGLDADARADLLAHATCFDCAEGAFLFREGEPADALYILEHGRLEIETRLPGDEAAAIGAIAPGEVVGEFALLDDAPRSASVLACAPSSGWRVARGSFGALLADGRGCAVRLAAALHRLVAQRTRATLDRIVAEARFDSPGLRAMPAAGGTRGEDGIEVAALFDGVARLAALAPDDAAGLAAAGRAGLVAKGTLVADCGVPADHALLVLRGALRAGLPREPGLEQVFVHGPGEWAGLAGFADGLGQPLLLAAAEDSVVLAIAREAVEAAPWRPAALALFGRQLVRDQRRANRHLGRAIALERYNAAGHAGEGTA
ncbi:MAG: cyclic nucleotide-binding domain-containing protein [Sphingomonadales bacterium]|nr:cyclic nucleotide-binding domain-containing protein [Sphingomonadales bacterium]MDE2569070.1 cyclic nucleotide-binding domain-containing protein [Sphingomonadales bacterium]